MDRLFTASWLRGLVPACVLSLGACGVETALIGAGVSAASSGFSQYNKGTIRSFELVRFEDAVAAVEVAAAQLSLERGSANVADHRVWYSYEFDRGATLTVEIKRVTETVTSIRVKSRSGGRRGMAPLLLRQVVHELAEQGAYLHRWDRADPRKGGAGAIEPG